MENTEHTHTAHKEIRFSATLFRLLPAMTETIIRLLHSVSKK